MIIMEPEKAKILATVTTEQWEAILEFAQNMLNGNPKENLHEEGEVREEECKDLHSKIIGVLKKIGVLPHLKGYLYLQEAVKLVYEDKSYISAVTKRLYPDIAKMHGTTSSRVERAIRHSIQTTFDMGHLTRIHQEIFGEYSVNKCAPTNSHAIAALAEYVKLNM